MPREKLKPRADGRLCKAITDPKTKKRVYFYGATEREINRKIIEYTTKQEMGRTFGEIADKWWEEAEPDLAHQTLRGYRPALKRALAEFGSMHIKSITSSDISRFYKELAAKKFTLKTISNNRIILNQVFEYAILYKDIEHNPCASAKMPKADKANKNRPLSPASPEDEERVLTSDHPWFFPLFALLTGLRKGELLALQWKDIDFENNIIYVTKSIGHQGDRPFIKEPKTEAGKRIVPLLNDLKEFLLKQPNKKPDHFIVSDTGKEPLTNRRYQTLSKHYKEQTGTTCTAHRLRHSFATNAYEKNVDVKGIQEIVGHKHISTTMNTYTHFRKESIKKAAEKLNGKSDKE